MDGDGHNARAFGWTEDTDGTDEQHAGIFDPAAIMRAIEEEEDDLPEAPAPADRAQPTADEALGAAVQVAMTFEPSVELDRDDAARAGDDEATGETGQAGDDLDEPGADGDDLDGDGLRADGPEWNRQGEDDGDGMSLSDVHDDIGDPEWDAPSEEDRPPHVEDDLAAMPQPDEDGDTDETGAFTATGHEDDGFDALDGARAVARADEAPGDAAATAAVERPILDDPDAPGRKPRIALMGEFSAGKSTLSNLLIGSAPLPTKVTATQLPPVWISWGDAEPYREDLDGDTHPIDMTRLADIDPAETRVIRIFAKSEILEQADIIDMPGISDPNMSSEVWERVIGKADGVIWCTHATQAWRQSEASVWESLDPKLFETSLLLVTRFDKLRGESDRTRVLRRVERETEGLFSARLPISLTEALAAGDDPELLEKSGAAAFRTRMSEILGLLTRTLGSDPDPRGARDRMRETLARDGQVAPVTAGLPTRDITPSRILPRRVRPMSEMAPGLADRGEYDHGR
jgi:hypothetical protein